MEYQIKLKMHLQKAISIWISPMIHGHLGTRGFQRTETAPSRTNVLRNHERLVHWRTPGRRQSTEVHWRVQELRRTTRLGGVTKILELAPVDSDVPVVVMNQLQAKYFLNEVQRLVGVRANCRGQLLRLEPLCIVQLASVSLATVAEDGHDRMSWSKLSRHLHSTGVRAWDGMSHGGRGLAPRHSSFLTVPFLAPPDAQWPTWLPSALNLGTLTLARSITDSYDLQIDDGWLTGECEGRCNVLRLNRMKSILKCIQPHCVVHVVFTTQLQASYFRWELFEKYLVTKCPHLMKTLFLRCETEGSVRPISGMERPVASPDRLVLFLAQRPPVVRRKSKISTTAASVPVAVGVGEDVNADTTMEGSEEARDDEAQEARSQTDQPVKKRRID